MIGITIRNNIGIGDKIQFTSLPENYFRATGRKLVDESRAWVFDHNPFVIRDPSVRIERTVELWNFGHPNKFAWPNPRGERRAPVYLSNAEIWASVLGVKAALIRPRLYYKEDFPFFKRQKILLHVDGKSHGKMPPHIIDHIIKKYGETGDLYQVGLSDDNLGIPKIITENVWELAGAISECRMFIGMDSGPSWIAACYPDVIVKKIRTNRQADEWNSWIPLEIKNIHSHWDDRCHMIYSDSEIDTGPFQSYLRI